ncbi:C6 transcription factor (fungal specific transcription factor) [Colletotrichum truncatum]|uniref:C6 transcription factor (Fungal specific transcription factor) n=1 Tax=Colletotrichum truncatum TaxID=5467 RepID=A0ACC3ZFA5_COLTU|nr:C6 transcription factor (fungal specific transcription factor) [Colletotrichum truncatum]KAF6801681.1 C6 transcription factor (fungal specific transcription factor) [Colletotrichum truncatum]
MVRKPTDNSTATGRPRRRAVEACIFCRKRKIKCNNEQPTCANCKTYGKDCVYEPLSISSNNPPSNSTPARDRAERRQRVTPRKPKEWANASSRHTRHSREVEEDRHSQYVDTPSPLLNDVGVSLGPSDQAQTDHQSEAPADQTPSHRTGVSRIVVSANGVSSYHGRTSALFEENPQERVSTVDLHPRMPDEWIEKGLVAEAAKQRQLEDFNYRAGTLDFDGVDPELGMHLLSLHWNRQHHSFLLTYRPAFMRDMACNGPYFSKILLNAIYFGASKFSPRREVRRDPDDVRTAGWAFRERVRKLLGDALDSSDITTIQALLVMTNSLFALGDERSAAWLYAGLAFRMIIDLGMHVDASGLGITRRFSDEDLEIRRRVFWGAFVVDKIQSLYQGRPASLKESDTLVPIKFLDTFEEFENWAPFAYSAQNNNYPGSPAYSVSTFTYLCRLSVVMSDILSCIYTERAFDKSPQELLTMLQNLSSKLAAWKDDLPTHLMFDHKSNLRIPPPHVLSLHAMYHVLTILLHRPFVADGHLYNTSRSISVNSFITCATAADNIVDVLRVYDQVFSVRHAPYLISYATYVAATIHVRIAAKRSTESGARECLETCLSVFRENQETNWAVRRAKAIVEGLMSRLGVKFAERDSNIATNNNPTSNTIETGLDLGERSRPERRQAATHLVGSNSNPSLPENESPSMGWSDIDGIIQTFVRGQDYNVGPVEIGQPELPPQVLPPATANQQSSGDLTGNVGNPSWIQGLPEGEGASVDDLLFGFNGSALDSFFY